MFETRKLYFSCLCCQITIFQGDCHVFSNCRSRSCSLDSSLGRFRDFVFYLYGVSGAFLLLPFQMSFLGYVNPSVSATNQLFNIVACPSGVYRYYKEGRMVWPLTWVVAAGTLPGVFIGAIVRVVYLPNPKNFKLFAAGVLLYIGIKMLRDLLRKNLEGSNKANSEKCFQEMVHNYRMKEANPQMFDIDSRSAVKVTHFNLKRLEYTFYGERFKVSFWGIFTHSMENGSKFPSGEYSPSVFLSVSWAVYTGSAVARSLFPFL